MDSSPSSLLRAAESTLVVAADCKRIVLVILAFVSGAILGGDIDVAIARLASASRRSVWAAGALRRTIAHNRQRHLIARSIGHPTPPFFWPRVEVEGSSSDSE